MIYRTGRYDTRGSLRSSKPGAPVLGHREPLFIPVDQSGISKTAGALGVLTFNSKCPCNLARTVRFVLK